MTVGQGILEANSATALGSIAAGTTVLDDASLQLTPTTATTYIGENLALAGSGFGLNPSGSVNFLMSREL